MGQEKGNAQGGEREINKPDGWVAYCDKCGKPFNSSDTVRVPYQEYPGAALSYEEASPCCGADYSDRPKEDASE